MNFSNRRVGCGGVGRGIGSVAASLVWLLLALVAATTPAWAQFGPQAYAYGELEVEEPTALAFSADERLVAVGDDDGRLTVFDLRTTRRIHQWRPLRSRVVGLEFVPDRSMLLAAGENRRIVAIDVRRGTVARELRTGKRIRSLDLSPNGRLVVWAGDDGAVEVLNSRLMRQDVLQSPNMFKRRLAYAAFGMQGSEIFAASEDDARSAFWGLGEKEPIRRDERDRESYTAFAHDHGGRLLALGVKSIYVGRRATAGGPREAGATGRGNDAGAGAIRDFAQGRALGGRLTVGARRTVRIVDWNRGRVVREIEDLRNDVRALAVAPDRSMVAIALNDGEIGGYSTVEARRIMSIHEGERANALEFSPGGGWLAAAMDRNGVMLWEVRGGTVASPAGRNVARQGDVLAEAARFEFTTGDVPLIEPSGGFSMAVLELDNLGVDPGLAASVMNLVVSRLANVSYVELVERGDVQQVLDELRFQNTGITSPRDAAEIGRLLNAENVVLGNVNQLGSSLTIALRLVETESGRVVGAREILCRQCRPEDLPQGVSLLVGSLVQVN